MLFFIFFEISNHQFLIYPPMVFYEKIVLDTLNLLQYYLLK